jgi:hypothetical protein
MATGAAEAANTKLLNAAYYGNTGAIIQALKEGADPNCSDSGEAYQTPLSYAAASDNAEAVSALLAGGADITESILAYFNAEDNDEILKILVRANPEYAFREFDKLDFIKGTEYFREKWNLEEAGYPEVAIRTDPELKRISLDILFAQKIIKMARLLRGGRRSRSRKKRTYRRRTFKR